jgi:hypothetical protein
MRIIKPLLGFALCGMAIGVLLQLAGVYESVANVYQAILGVAFVGSFSRSCVVSSVAIKNVEAPLPRIRVDAIHGGHRQLCHVRTSA